jgi:hypothetical protein
MSTDADGYRKLTPAECGPSPGRPPEYTAEHARLAAQYLRDNKKMLATVCPEQREAWARDHAIETVRNRRSRRR